MQVNHDAVPKFHDYIKDFFLLLFGFVDWSCFRSWGTLFFSLTRYLLFGIQTGLMKVKSDPRLPAQPGVSHGCAKVKSTYSCENPDHPELVPPPPELHSLIRTSPTRSAKIEVCSYDMAASQALPKSNTILFLEPKPKWIHNPCKMASSSNQTATILTVII